MRITIIRSLGKVARTLTFMAVGGIAFYFVFSYVFYPALIVSGITLFVSTSQIADLRTTRNVPYLD